MKPPNLRQSPSVTDALVAPRSFQELLDRYDLSVEALHPVARTIIERATSGAPSSGGYQDGRRLGLVVEGGAMRGIVSLGMLVLLEQLGATDVFDETFTVRQPGPSTALSS